MTSWTNAMKGGKIETSSFTEEVSSKSKLGLLFVPVVINGKTYNFLFDSGAPLSISNKIQQELNYKIISKGYIRDSDENRQAVEYAMVERMAIGDIQFLNQTALITDFEASAALKCLKIDGIIGSNLIRQCNWTIDMQAQCIQFSDQPISVTNPLRINVPFQTDAQYNIKVKLKLHETSVSNFTVDYGSNGSISIPHDIFKHIAPSIHESKKFKRTGYAQTGIIGKTVQIERQVAIIDSLMIQGLTIESVKSESGGNALIGTAILNNFSVTIDWMNHELILLPQPGIMYDYTTFGFSLGLNKNQEIIVQSVTSGSDAWEKGVLPNQKVIKLERLDFAEQHDYCDYIDWLHYPYTTAKIELLDSNQNRIVHELTRKKLTH